MNKKNLIQFVQSLVLLPLVTGSVPLNSLIKADTLKETSKTVFIQKENSIANGLIALNQAVDEKAKELEARLDSVRQAKADAIDAYFEARDMPLFGTGMKMAEEADKNDLDWRLLPAIAARESTGGKNDCIKVDNNPFGWGSCRIGFKTIDDAIETVAKNLGGNNPSTKRHYGDKTLKGILQAYNPPSIVANYANQVIRIMNTIGKEDLNTTAGAS